ncbi:MAG: radical SAM protein, partial [Planctomycetaceae bacterium]|nr:radical SAM protein [Planctomycetaceae bacterium]
VQFSKENIHDADKSLKEKFLGSTYLKEFRQLARSTTRGCVVLERPDLLKQLMEKEEVADGTARQTALAELDAMEVRTSQYNPAHQIPEKSWVYRFAKRHWYNDFGVYEGYDHSESAAPALVQLDVPESVTAE